VSTSADAASQAINAVAGIFKQEMNDLIEANPNVIVVVTTVGAGPDKSCCGDRVVIVASGKPIGGWRCRAVPSSARSLSAARPAAGARP
jgi:hypothetical protein